MPKKKPLPAGAPGFDAYWRCSTAVDCTQRFEKILDLPAEVRARIYDFYIATFPDTTKCPVQPPLSRTCRLIRQEVLPMFYRQIRFEINYIRCFQQRWFPFRMHALIFTTRDTPKFLRGLPHGQIANLHRLRLDIRVHNRRDSWAQKGLLIFDVNLKEQSGTANISDDTNTTPLIGRGAETWLVAGHTIWDLLQDIDLVDGRRVVNMKHFYALRKAIENGWNDSRERY